MSDKSSSNPGLAAFGIGTEQGPRPGRKRGSLNTVSKEAREFAARILDSREYRESLVRRIKAGTLPSNIEALLYHYRFGKPKETIEVQMSPAEVDLSQLSNEELARRAELLAQAARAAEVAQEMVTEPGTESLESIVDGTQKYGLGGALELTDLPTNGSKH
jgi:hypothetical protein